MDIIANDTNVVVLFGNGAVRRFSELVNGWSAMLPAAGMHMQSKHKVKRIMCFILNTSYFCIVSQCR